MKRIILITLAVLSLAATLTGCGKTNQSKDRGKKIRIGFLMETYDLDRWQRDQNYFIAKADSLGAEVLRAVADGDQDRQNKQADIFLTQGVNVLVVIPKNFNTAGRIIRSAREKNVPVVAYDRLILNCDLDLYITFDNENVGYLQAEGILAKVPQGNFILLGGASSDNNAKLLREGQLRAIREHEASTGKKITILADPFMDNWDREEARRRVSNMLTRFRAERKTVDAIVASNDATAGGAVAALMAEGLQGKVAVSGQDAELTACQRIAEGTQSVTVYKPIRTLAEISAEAAVRLAKKESPEDIARSLGYKLSFLDNGTKQVPSIFLRPVCVTKENMVSAVVKDGWHPLRKVYTNVPKEYWPKE